MRQPTEKSSSATRRMIFIASAIVGVLIVVVLAVVLLMGPSTPNGSTSARGSGTFPGRSGQQFQAFQTCLKQHGVTLPSGGGFGGGFGGGNRPPGGGFGGGAGGANSKNGSAIAACRSLITGGSSSTTGGTSLAA